MNYSTASTPMLASTGAAVAGLDVIWIALAGITAILVGIAIAKFFPKKKV